MKERILKVKDVDELKLSVINKGIKGKKHNLYSIKAYPGDFWQISHKLGENDIIGLFFEGQRASFSTFLKRDEYLEMAKKHNLRLISSKKPTITFNPNYNVIMDEFLEQKINIGILDKVEKEYLSTVIKPFRDKVDFITKYSDIYTHVSEEYIVIDTNCGDDIIFPNFKKGTMYEGMEANKKYTLEELGL